MQATVRMALVNQFKDRLREGNTVTLQRYSLGEIQPKFRIVANPLRLSFLSNTECAECSDFTGSKHGFLFRPFKTIVELKKEEDGQFGMYILLYCIFNLISFVHMFKTKFVTFFFQPLCRCNRPCHCV